jgi:excisionase family DNA binding protein
MTDDELDKLADRVAARLAATTSLLNASGAGELLNVPATWVLAEARDGRIPHLRLGKYVRFRRDDLLEWIAKRTS